MYTLHTLLCLVILRLHRSCPCKCMLLHHVSTEQAIALERLTILLSWWIQSQDQQTSQCLSCISSLAEDGLLYTQEADSAEQLMSAFGTAAGLIQQSEYVRCQSEQAGPNTSLQEAGSGIGEVDAESLEAAKQVQAELHQAMHAALSTNNGYLIIPTMPGPPIQRRQAFALCTDHHRSRTVDAARMPLCIHLSRAAQSAFLHACVQGLHCVLWTQLHVVNTTSRSNRPCDGLAVVGSNCQANTTDLVSPVHQLMIWSSLRGARLSCQHLQHCLESLRYDVRHLCRYFCICKFATARTVSVLHIQLCISAWKCVSRFQRPCLPFCLISSAQTTCLQFNS